jgi:hypothetical protein
MKSQFVRIVLTAGLTTLGSLTLSAQDKVENAKIPFAFQANHTALSAGDYKISEYNLSGTFQILSVTDGHSTFVNVPSRVEGKPDAGPHLTFACYEGNCVLSEIWMPGGNGYKRSESAVDHDLQRKLGMATMISVRLSSR